LRGHLDIRRGEQEDLVGHLIDGPAQAEDQSRREVDETPGVAVDHLGQVHDHRGAFAEVLTDGPGFIVSARVECRDTGELDLPRRGRVRRRLGYVAAVVGAHRRGFHRFRLLVVLVAVLVVCVVTILIAAFVLHEAKVDRHLAHRAGHPSVLRRTTATRRRVPNSFQLPYATDTTGPGAFYRRATPYQFSGVSRRRRWRPPGRRSCPLRRGWQKGSLSGRPRTARGGIRTRPAGRRRAAPPPSGRRA